MKENMLCRASPPNSRGLKTAACRLAEMEDQKQGLGTHTLKPERYCLHPQRSQVQAPSGITGSYVYGPTSGWSMTAVIMPHAHLQKLMPDSEMPPNHRTPLPGLPKHSSSPSTQKPGSWAWLPQPSSSAQTETTEKNFNVVASDFPSRCQPGTMTMSVHKGNILHIMQATRAIIRTVT